MVSIKKLFSKNKNSDPDPVLGQRGLITWAVVGDVLDTSKPAFNVASSIESQDRILYRVSPTLDPKDASPKKRLYKKFLDIPSEVKIDAVNLCVNYRIGLVVLEGMEKRGIKYCFIQPGADHADLLKRAEELRIVYQTGCMIVQRMVDLDEDEKRIVDEQKKGMESDCACNIL